MIVGDRDLTHAMAAARRASTHTHTHQIRGRNIRESDVRREMCTLPHPLSSCRQSLSPDSSCFTRFTLSLLMRHLFDPTVRHDLLSLFPFTTACRAPAGRPAAAANNQKGPGADVTICDDCDDGEDDGRSSSDTHDISVSHLLIAPAPFFPLFSLPSAEPAGSGLSLRGCEYLLQICGS